MMTPTTIKNIGVKIKITIMTLMVRIITVQYNNDIIMYYGIITYYLI